MANGTYTYRDSRGALINIKARDVPNGAAAAMALSKAIDPEGDPFRVAFIATR